MIPPPKWLPRLQPQAPLASCPGRKPPKTVIKCPARPYKSTRVIYKRQFTVGNAKGTYTPREGPDSVALGAAAGGGRALAGLKPTIGPWKVCGGGGGL
jgi:hypothetical protein